MLGRRDTASAIFFDRPSSALESALQANTHTHVVRAIVRIFSSGGVRVTIQNARRPVRALRLRVGGPHLPKLCYVFVLVIYICRAMLYVMQLVRYVFVLVIYICRACATSPRW